MTATVFAALFPVFALIALGYACGRRQWLGEGGDRILNDFVATIALPALTFHVLAGMDPGDLAEPSIFVAVVGSSWLLFGLSFLTERVRGLDRARANIAALGAAYGNSAFIGLPICLALWGPASLGPSAVVMALNTAFIFGGGALTTALASAEENRTGRPIAAAVRLVATNPLILAALAGVLVALAGISLPPPVDALLRMISAATAPCALIAIGLFIARPLPPTGGTGATWRSVAAKLLALPLITAALLWLLPPLPPVWRDTVLVMSAMPCGASCFVLARGGGEDTLRLAARLIVLSTIGASISLPLYLLFLLPGR